MKREIIYNNYNLQENEMTDLVVKVKLLLINDNNEILLVYAQNDYTFPGGTHEEGEELIETINREIEEEIGVKTNYEGLEPFVVTKGYYKDWPEVGRNKRIEINYYAIPFNLKPNLENLNLTENEKKENFTLKYIDFDKLEDIVKANIEEYGDQRGIGNEMLNVLKIYKENK